MAMNQTMINQEKNLINKIVHLKEQRRMHQERVQYLNNMIHSYRERIESLEKQGKEMGLRR